jgi:hypothetical protein
MINEDHVSINLIGHSFAFSISCVNTEPPKPKGELLANAIASYSFFTFKKSAAGSKNSS